VRPIVRGVVVDIDGTVTDAERRVHAPALEGLQRLERRGIPVVLATGNVLPIAIALLRFFGLHGPIVAENGGLLYERRRGLDRITRLADPRFARRALRRLTAGGIQPRPLLTNRWRETELAFEPGLPVARARRILRGLGVEVVPTGYAVHLIEAGRGKLPALRRALRPWRIRPEDCLVAGDGDNDVEMLRVAAYAVSFPTGSARARRAATYVTRASYAKGIVEALKRVRFVPPARVH
jgi:phosphoglycolate phosphatase